MIKISGIVVKGKQKGRLAGFPTANIEIKREVESGVYAAKTRVSGKAYNSAVFVSRNGDVLESHIMGFSGDLYGREIEVELRRKIRDIKIFENTDDLAEQIKKDIVICSREL